MEFSSLSPISETIVQVSNLSRAFYPNLHAPASITFAPHLPSPDDLIPSERLKTLAPGSGLQAPGSRLQAPSSRLQVAMEAAGDLVILEA
jgi:hypothetical protein